MRVQAPCGTQVVVTVAGSCACHCCRSQRSPVIIPGLLVFQDMAATCDSARQ